MTGTISYRSGWNRIGIVDTLTNRNITAKRSHGLAFALASAACLAFVFPMSQALAGSSTSWIEGAHATTRLVVDTVEVHGNGKALVAGIHIKLDEGWKTYWRNPGDAGLPPRFDWSGSQNLKAAKVLWPAPQRLKDSAGISYGYKKEIVFPVILEPEKPGVPVKLNLKLEFAVCEDICIPAEANLQLATGKGGFFSRSYASLLSRYIDRVPVQIEPGPRPGLSISRAEANLSGPAPALTVDAHIPGGAEGADLFVEGPEGFYMAPAELAGPFENETVKFRVDLTKGDDPKGLEGEIVTLTLVSPEAQAETSWLIE